MYALSSLTPDPPQPDCALYPAPGERTRAPPAVWPYRASTKMAVCSASPPSFAERCCTVFGGNVTEVCGWPMCLADVEWEMWNACMRLADQADSNNNWGWAAQCDALDSGADRAAAVGWKVWAGVLALWVAAIGLG